MLDAQLRLTNVNACKKLLCLFRPSWHCRLRRTKAALIYKQTSNLRAVQILLGHTKIESTAHYLGVDIEDTLALAEGTGV